MKKEEFQRYIQDNIIILDGATGTQLQKKGMPTGVCPEQWVLENPEILKAVQKEYKDAGSNAVYTCTFGANKIKLGEFGLEDNVIEINRKIAEISRQAVGRDVLVGGDIGPTGKFISPIGELSFEEMVKVYKEQVQGLLQGGVDFFIIETMMDIQETRAAILSIKESCDLPICVTMTFDENGRTLTGTEAKVAIITLQSMGIDAMGCNCSTGPKQMLDIISGLREYSYIPLIAKPNAGLPNIVDGKTVFSMEAKEFGSYVKRFIELGVHMIGGCCGTSPEYISQIKENIIDIKPKQINVKSEPDPLTSMRSFRDVGGWFVIGGMINPSYDKALEGDLAEGNMDELIDLAMNQVDEGAEILDINVYTSETEEKRNMLEALENLYTVVYSPLSINSNSPEVIEAALRVYPGRALVNASSVQDSDWGGVLSIVKKYGAMCILPKSYNKQILENSEAKCKSIERIWEKSERYGLSKNEVFIDVEVNSGSPEKSALETLKVIDWCKNIFGSNSLLDLSTDWIDEGFLKEAKCKGLKSVIANSPEHFNLV